MLKPRVFAHQVVEKLQSDGFQALWAGGCVRDEMLGRIPKDYDVATNATPEQVRELFGNKRTFPVGEAFGVILLRGPQSAGEIEIATFRRDVGYSDGRRPDRVEFTSAEEDAQRRDFTINGMFFDPIANKHLDFVGGAADLKRGVVRAIGNPVERFNEDKLRMLRAVRFAATFDFAIAADTLATIKDRPGDIDLVSGERIGMEFRRMLEHSGRGLAAELLSSTGLLAKIIPQLESGSFPVAEIRQSLERLDQPGMAVALSVILQPALLDGAAVKVVRKLVSQVAERIKLSNLDSKLIEFLLSNEPHVHRAQSIAWPRMQRILIDDLARDLLAFAAATAREASAQAGVEFCEAKHRLPREVWDPPALLDGNDLKSRGIPSGRIYKELLTTIRDAQLVGEIGTADEAWRVVDQIMSQRNDD